jgi:hypothetical protein
MSSTNLQCIPIITDHNKRFYLLDGFRYHLNFPLAWAMNHKNWEKNPDVYSGPKMCSSCRTTGCLNDVFVCYCFNCQKLIYKSKRLTPIDGMDKLPPAIYHWQMGTTASLYGLDKEVLLESGLIPQPPSPLSVADIDISEDFDDFNVLEAIHYEKNGL